jgi:hypothetical protein
VTFTPPTDEQMTAMRDAMVEAARKTGAELGLEEIGIANGLSFAAVTILNDLCLQVGNPEAFIWAVRKLGQTNLSAAEEMLAARTANPRLQ